MRRGEKNIALSNLNIYYTWKNIQSSYHNNKFEILINLNTDKFELPAGSCSVSDLQDYFDYILKKHGENMDNPSISIYVNKVENRITFKIKTEYYLKLLTAERMNSLEALKKKISKVKIDENAPHLEITEVVLVNCNIVNHDYQQDSRVLYTFISNKPFGSLL